MEIDLKITANEALDLIKVLGQLPTSSNAYPLMVKINEQLQAQLPKDNEAVV